MQIEALKVTDFLKTNEENSIGRTASSVDKEVAKKGHEELRAVKVDNAFYDKKGKKVDETEEMLKDINTQSQLGASTMNTVNNLEKGVNEAVIEETEKNGLDAMDMDTKAIVTVIDEIKMNLAKAGVDVSKMGGLDKATIENLTGSVAQAVEMTNGIDATLSDEVKKYLVTNELEPTILNIYNASYSAPTNNGETELSDNELINILAQLSDKLDEMINNVEGADKDLCAKMLANDIPLTEDNLSYMVELDGFVKPEEEVITQAIADIILEDKDPKEAYLVEGYSLMDQARVAVEEVNSVDIATLNDVQARIQLEEVRIIMTVEATFTMMKNGIDVDTTNISKLIEDLKAQQTSLLDILMRGEKGQASEADLSIYTETMSKLADIEASPVEMFGRFTNVSQATITEIHQVSMSFSAEYKNMEMTYEAVGTEVRKDLGDNINKAFRNVDDILSDIGIEITESSEKAVRALAYNQMDITKDAVVSMKSEIELVQRTFRNMTPAVVTEIIKRGDNPLDVKIEDLLKKTEEIKSDMGNTTNEESFSKFLWKLEHTDGISEDERDSYIGIYRLLNQVEKSDGAAISALMSTGTEITLRNLMTAVRSSKRTGKEYEVSENQGAVETVADLSITQQIERVFYTNRCRDAKEAMTPAKMQELSEDTILEMDPDEFATAMETAEDTKSQAEYNKYIAENLKQAVAASREAYQVIEDMNLPTTANVISAVEAMIKDNNSYIKNLFGKMSEQEDMDIEDIIEELTERFLEACDTPEEMAEAEEALGVLAENVMKTMINEEDVTTIDMNGMKLIIQQSKVNNMMARESETYHIPIMVADEAGNMSLKIVRGTNENGLVKMALKMANTGTITSTFRYEKGNVDASLTCETNEMREAFAGDAAYIAQRMQEETGFSFSFMFGRDSGISANEIYKNETGNFDYTNDRSDIVQTEALYGIAKSFISIVGEMFS